VRGLDNLALHTNFDEEVQPRRLRARGKELSATATRRIFLSAYRTSAGLACRKTLARGSFSFDVRLFDQFRLEVETGLISSLAGSHVLNQ
jgi:hypothetical protein